jgi:hypothetical protein
MEFDSMKKFFSLIAIVLFSVVAVSAQTRAKGSTSDLQRSHRAGAEKRVANHNAAKFQDARAFRLRPSTIYLKNGLSTDEVLRLLGTPTSISERLEGNSHLATYIFHRSEGRIFVAEFENGVLINSRTEDQVEISRRTPRPA